MVRLVAVIDSTFGDADIERAGLGTEFTVRTAQATTESDVIAAGAGAEGAFVQWAPMTRAVFESLPALRAIVRYGVGLDNVDLAAAADHGVVVRNVADYCTAEVADHALAFIVAHGRQLAALDDAIKVGAWSVETAPLPPGRDPVGLVGYGRIGRALAARLRCLGYPVTFWDPLFRGEPASSERVDSLAELADRSNHLSLHVPLTESTKGMIDGTTLVALGPGGHLVNTARGGLVDERALLAALVAGDLGWASLDVFGTEPPSGVSLELAKHRRVTATPHLAYLSTESPTRLRRMAAESLRDVLESDVVKSPRAS